MKSHLLLIAFFSTLAASAQDDPSKRFIGPPIDVSSWSYQRAVKFDHAGVIELDLDPTVLVHSGGDLNDVRVVRMGRQIPFLAVKPGADREVEVSIAEAIDPKTPLLSKWDIQMPAAHFPVSELLLETSTPSFTHAFSITEVNATKEGSAERILGNASAQRKPGEAARAIHLPLNSAPKEATIRLTATDGTTPRLVISSARVSYPLVRLLFRVPDTEPVYLCYGNSVAINPRYDLQFTRKDFDTSGKIVATLGQEEKPSNQIASINSVVGKMTWNWEGIKDKCMALVAQVDTSNPWHLAGLILGGLLLLKILMSILFGRRS